MYLLACAGGLILLAIGGDVLVRGSVSIARHIGVSPLLIGITLVGFGTSTPELVTSVDAALAGSPGIAVGNVVGSNIANILMILGFAALIHPIATSRQAFQWDGSVVLLATITCVAVVLLGRLDRLVGVLLVAALIGYVLFVYRRERVVHDASAIMHETEAESVDPMPSRLGIAALFSIGGLLLTIIGARLLVQGSIELAKAAGVSETLVGLTIVAVGTSLPELVTSIVASLRRQPDVAFGNIVGSNIYNVLGVLGATAIVRPILVPSEIAAFDVWIMLAATLLLLLFAISGWRVTRLEGGLLLGSYGAYVGYLGIFSI